MGLCTGKAVVQSWGITRTERKNAFVAWLVLFFYSSNVLLAG